MVLIRFHQKLYSVVFVLILTLSGCGQKGALILSSTPIKQLETSVIEIEPEEKQKLAEDVSNNAR
jgi:predicted small lipoprotein YifL